MNDPVKIEIVNGKPSVTSLQIAEAFGKSHKNVLADIRVTIAKCSESFTGLNFQLSGYKDSTGRNLPESLNSSERGETMQTAIGAMDDALSSLENADSRILDAMG